MSIQIEQLLWATGFIFAFIAIWRIDNIYIVTVIILILLALFLFNPVKLNHEGISKIERRNSNHLIELPEKINVKIESFDKKQKNQMEKFKLQTKEMIKNEIN